MSDVAIRIQGRAGRITLTRPQALNALTYDMLRAIETAIDGWATDDTVTLVIIDAIGDKAFCAGGDIAELYAAAMAGDLAFGRRFWRDEYRLNAKLAEYPKPVISFMQGFTMGGGVGLGCHAAHRVVCETSQIAMPEVGIGLVPDVGGSMLLANAPGQLGAYLATTAARMSAGDAIFAGFADHFVQIKNTPELIENMSENGDIINLMAATEPPPEGPLLALLDQINTSFGGATLGDILSALHSTDNAFAAKTLDSMRRNSPLSMACAIDMLHRLHGEHDVRRALELEYRFTYRAIEDGDFLEGIRAAIIDKDRNPKWQHGFGPVPPATVTQMLLPLGENALTFE